MDTKIILIGGGLAALAAYLFSKKNETKKDTKNQDKTTEDLSDLETQQALQLKSLLNPEKNIIIGWTTNNLKSRADYPKVAEILNTILNITNWSKVQKKFLALCNNEFTLLNALQSALPVDLYNKAVKLAGAKKLVTNQDITGVTIYDKTLPVGLQTVNFKKNTLIGALDRYSGNYVYFINGYKSDGAVLKDLIEMSGYYTDKSKIKEI